MRTEYIPKTQAVLEVMKRPEVGRFVVERQINKMEEAGSTQFINDPRGICRKLISFEHVEAVIPALLTI